MAVPTLLPFLEFLLLPSILMLYYRELPCVTSLRCIMFLIFHLSFKYGASFKFLSIINTFTAPPGFTKAALWLLCNKCPALCITLACAETRLGFPLNPARNALRRGFLILLLAPLIDSPPGIFSSGCS